MVKKDICPSRDDAQPHIFEDGICIFGCQTLGRQPMKPLYKTTIVIWSEYDGSNCELSALAREAESGDAYCSRYRSEQHTNPEMDSDWDGTEFFEEDESILGQLGNRAGFDFNRKVKRDQ